MLGLASADLEGGDPPAVLTVRGRRLPRRSWGNGSAMATTKARGAGEFVPGGADFPTLKKAAATCRGCDLYKNATQTVFGDGDPDARIMLLGEKPGDREDREGQPFVGPAGRMLAKALEEAGIDRSSAYVTNVVKHFKFTERGKRRIHQTPNRTEIVACRPWLVAEFEVVEPEIVVCLGATAAKAIFGPSFRLTQQRGQCCRRQSWTAPLGTRARAYRLWPLFTRRRCCAARVIARRCTRGWWPTSGWPPRPWADL